ncbi:MAG: hypothetical protein BWY99_00376 [Synergistetes bacterium ADurb.BinA166]|nr:MAG: hypothetical protein BWY99_00376 [Synergistetes bacterium ADurb.BinA166]
MYNYGNMYPQADSVVRTLMPAVLDQAGLRTAAARLRSLGRLESPEGAVEACAMLSEVRETSDGAADGWEGLVEEAAFWSEAAVRCAFEGDKASFSFCVGRVRAEMDRGLQLLRLH